MFRPVKTKKVYEEIVEQIKELIIDGKLQPGDRLLSERELSEKLNVSRASVREAFSALEMMGVISIRPGEGSFVRKISFEGMLEPLSFLLQLEIEDIMPLLEVRKIMEVETAGLAALRATKQDIDDMAAALNHMVEASQNDEIGDVADAAFHFAVTRAASNPILIRIMNAISDLMVNAFRSSRQKLYLVESMPQLLYESHYGIYEAIIAKDSQLARKRMHDHLSMVEATMLELKYGGTISKHNQHSIASEYK